MKFGFHISSAAGTNSGWLQKFNSPVNLILATGIGGEIPRLLQIAELCPQSLLVYRAWTYGTIGQSDHFESYYAKYGSDPLPLIEAYQPCFDAFRPLGNRVFYQLWNETGHDLWMPFIDFNTNYVKEMSKRGLSCSVLGLGPGFPTGTREEIRSKWNVARPLFEAINNSPVPHLINLHEYYGYPVKSWEPYLFGRYRWLVEDLRSMGLLSDKIKIFAGENSWADPAALDRTLPPNPANGYKGFLLKGITPEQLADDLVEGYQDIYEVDKHFIGTCHYCLGDSGGWSEFDLLNEPRILEEIQRKMSTWTVVPTDEIKFNVVADKLNIRFAPTLTAQIIGSKTFGEFVTTNGYVDNDGYRWRQLTNSEGYCAEKSLTILDVFLTEAVVTDWKTEVLTKISLIQQELDNLKTLINNI